MSIIDHLKRLMRHSFIYTISTFVQRALGFVLLPVYTSCLPDTSAYGDYALVYTFVAFMNIVYLYGMDAALMRYFFLGEYKREDIYKTAFTAVSINTLFLSILIYLFASPLAEVVFSDSGYAFFIKIAAGILFLDALCNLPYQILRAEEKSIAYTCIRTGRFIVELVLNIIFVVKFDFGVKGILYANFIAAFLNFLVLIPFQLKYFKGAFRKDALKVLLKFALPMLPNGLAYLTVEVSDKYLMNTLLDKETLGIYAPNYKFGSVLLFVVLAFRTAWQPFFLKIAKESNAKEIYSKVLTYFTLAGVMIVVLGSYYIEYIVKFPIYSGKTIMHSAYWDGIVIIPIILASYLFYGIYVNLTVGIYIRKKTSMMIVFTGLAALVNVGSNFYLMPHYGIMGAAVATLLSYAVMAVSIFIANQRIYPVRYEYGRILFLLIYLTVMLFLYYQFNLSFIWRTGLIIFSPLLFLLSGFLKKEEITFLKSKLKR